ncbi:MAG: AAA family ATPase [Bacteroidia bacterium]|nr:AAA family ATPase [Bacteroidia bacterium]
MKNSLGKPATDDAFYDREKEIKKIYRVLETGTSIYLAAPRRVGKTSILKHLEESPKDGFYFVYIITESVDTKNEFFKVLFEELIKSKAIQNLSKISHSIKDVVTGLLGRVNSINGVELREGKEPDYFELLVDLFSNISKEHARVIVMIDEFPQTIQNIMEIEGKKSAENFLQKNREIRHHKNIQEKISFIYTGSISLFPMVEKVTSLTAINDLRTVSVEPLEPDDAKFFLSLLLQNDNIVIKEGLIDYVLIKMSWLIPFHLQLIEQEIVDVFESDGKEIDEVAINKAFDQVVHSRNKPQFEPYFARLAKIFKGEEYKFVMEVLTITAKNDKIEPNVLNDMGVKHQLQETKTIMEILESDGYIFENGGHYRYTSPILQLWCKKHICQ